ncbi:MAG: hypothetical protein RID53_01990 [Coleofasciculus sp. B1-GNL1-01]|uniref:hypothetical protein n=1 Tax=Coleofasciculus sp. B1-GNL1-01 TaxID=3068484 RepID=UPI0032FBD7D2
MDRKIIRLCLLIVSCSAVGLVVGGTAAQAELNQCLGVATPTDECLLQDPMVKTVEGMGMGLLAGVGASVGAVWQIWQNKSVGGDN